MIGLKNLPLFIIVVQFCVFSLFGCTDDRKGEGSDNDKSNGQAEHCTEESDCSCGSCVDNVCKKRTESCDDLRDNDCDGDTDENCCDHECTGNSNKCEDGVLFTCVLRENCWSWDESRNCVNGVCTSETTCDICWNACELGATTCRDGQIRSCIINSRGCYIWEDFSDCEFQSCADNKSCSTSVTAEITHIFPTHGPTGVPLIIEGRFFGNQPEDQRVEIGGEEAEVKSWSNTYLVVIVPDGISAGSADVTVFAPGQPSSEYMVTPWIKEVSPFDPQPGETTTASGVAFGADQGEASVRDESAEIQDWSDQAVELEVSEEDVGGKTHLQLTTADGINSNRFPLHVRGNDIWIPMKSLPSVRGNSTAVWTGSEMIIWGGDNKSYQMNSGKRYDPVTDSWLAMSTEGAPSMRYWHTAVWTGSEMIVWGGKTEDIYHGNGGRYLP